MQLMLIRALTILSLAIAVAQANADDGATIRGKITQQTDRKFQIDVTAVPLKLQQIVEIPDPPYPANWNEMSPEKRRDWLKKFEESKEGQTYIEVNEKKLDDAAEFDVTIENSGKFIVYDVPVGRYGLRGRLDKDFDGINYAFEVFGEVNVVKEVDELLLEPLMIAVTPLFQAGDQAPDFKINNFNDTGHWELKHFAGKYVLIQFWSREFSPPSAEYQSKLQEMYSNLQGKHKFDLLSVCMDKDRDKAVAWIREKKLQGRHAFTGGWDHPCLDAYGIRRIPSFWLIDPSGKIKMTNVEFNQAFASGKSSLAQIVDDRITGKDVPTPVAPSNDKKNTASTQGADR